MKKYLAIRALAGDPGLKSVVLPVIRKPFNLLSHLENSFQIQLYLSSGVKELAIKDDEDDLYKIYDIEDNIKDSLYKIMLNSEMTIVLIMIIILMAN